MVARSNRGEAGAALITVVLIILVLAAVGAFVIIAVDRNTEKQAAFTKEVAGFYAAEAGLNRGAGDTRNIFLGFGVPENCSPQSMTVNERTVTYQLSGCGQSPSTIAVPAGEPFEGLNAIRYVYDLRSEAVNVQGFTEAILKMRFESRLIPMFQLAAFYKDDLELTVGPPMVINGRMHTNRDMYLNTESCSPGARILGQVTVAGDLYRGRKDDLTYSNSGNVWIANPDGSLRIFGRTGIGDTSCAAITTRMANTPDPPNGNEVGLWNGRVRIDLKDVSLPGQDDLLCAPWSCPTGKSPGSYWQFADLRIGLNTTRLEKLDPSGPGPALYALEVYDSSGNVDYTLTDRLKLFVREVPGGITYSDVPTSPACVPGSSCEANYKDREDYARPFPNGSPGSPDLYGCTGRRGDPDPNNPNNNGARTLIDATNYCNDFRYGGFYNWRERKPILMLNIDWMKLEEWNREQWNLGQGLFNPNDDTQGGLVIYATVRGDRSGYSGTASMVNNYGVRLFNAQRVRRGDPDSGDPDRGITFASDQAVYVMGNFNCRAPSISSDSVPARCGGNGKKPAAVVGDTLNVLSCRWVDTAPTDGAGPCRASFSMGVNEGGSAYRPLDERSTTARTTSSSSKPSASQTFINAAFLAGNDTTTCPGNPGGRDCQRDYYSGGLENYPRFHENWGGQRFWYEGSFVAIDTPKHTCFTFNAGLTTVDDALFSCRTYTLNGSYLQGYWRMQEYYGYSPPPRRWFYDVSFNDAANLPPLSPRFVTLRQTFFTEEFR